MSRHLATSVPAIFGQVSLFRIREDGYLDPRASRRNQLQISWGLIAAMTIGFGRKDYRIQGMYIEYENVADPDDPVTPPDYPASEGLEYYADLALSGTRDYLRVPLVQQPQLGIIAGDEASFVAGETGNKLTFFAQTQGTQGANGKPFGSASNSKVFGLGLVAIPTFQDATQDVIFARTYFDAADQEVKLPSSQIGVTWEINFPI
jgi:hypothetical protein